MREECRRLEAYIGTSEQEQTEVINRVQSTASKFKRQYSDLSEQVRYRIGLSSCACVQNGGRSGLGLCSVALKLTRQFVG